MSKVGFFLEPLSRVLVSSRAIFDPGQVTSSCLAVLVTEIVSDMWDT